jgi:mannose-1-phosphate guanylyltransferase
MNAAADHVWTVVLAAGEGTRLRPLTRALHGEDLPKQFAVIAGKRSLLQTTVRRAMAWSRAEHIVVVVAEEREALARAQLEHYGPIEIVAQPRNAGTGPGVMLPVMHIHARDPRARIVVMPSDQYVRDEEPFAEAIHAAQAAARRSGCIVLVGAVPEQAEEQYGWIVPAPDPETGRNVVSAFVEKPSAAVAHELRRSGALWSTFVMVGTAADFAEQGKAHLPEPMRLLHRYVHALGTRHETEVLHAIYEEMPDADFSRDVLQQARRLEVVELPPCGWSDWGTPERVLASLHGTADFAGLLERLSARVRKSFLPNATPATVVAELCAA